MKIRVLSGDDLKPGTHITGVGSLTPQMQEVDPTTVKRARIMVDPREACLTGEEDIIILEEAESKGLGTTVELWGMVRREQSGSSG